MGSVFEFVIWLLYEPEELHIRDRMLVADVDHRETADELVELLEGTWRNSSENIQYLFPGTLRQIGRPGPARRPEGHDSMLWLPPRPIAEYSFYGLAHAYRTPQVSDPRLHATKSVFTAAVTDAISFPGGMPIFLSLC